MTTKLPLSEVSACVHHSLIFGEDSLSRNLNKPSNVCAAVPRAANAVWMTPRMALRMDWKTATMELSAAVMAWKIEERREPSWSTREGIFVVA